MQTDRNEIRNTISNMYTHNKPCIQSHTSIMYWCECVCATAYLLVCAAYLSMSKTFCVCIDAAISAYRIFWVDVQSKNTEWVDLNGGKRERQAHRNSSLSFACVLVYELYACVIVYICSSVSSQWLSLCLCVCVYMSRMKTDNKKRATHTHTHNIWLKQESFIAGHKINTQCDWWKFSELVCFIFDCCCCYSG